MTRKEVEEFFRSKGYTFDDKYGNITYELPATTISENGITRSYDSRKYRYKFNKTSLRHEIRLVSIKEWVRLSSQYYVHLSISPEGKLVGMKR